MARGGELLMGRDHSEECERCGALYGGFNGPDECPCPDQPADRGSERVTLWRASGNLWCELGPDAQGQDDWERRDFIPADSLDQRLAEIARELEARAENEEREARASAAVDGPEQHEANCLSKARAFREAVQIIRQELDPEGREAQ